MGKLQKWLWSVALKKGLKRGVQAVLAIIGMERIATYGVSVDPVVMTAGVYALLEVARNYLKNKQGWGWL